MRRGAKPGGAPGARERRHVGARAGEHASQRPRQAFREPPRHGRDATASGQGGRRIHLGSLSGRAARRETRPRRPPLNQRGHRMTLLPPARAAIATGLAIAAVARRPDGHRPRRSSSTRAGAACREPVLPPVVWPCSQIASISPASARPGQDVDIHIRPPSGRRTSSAYSVVGVQFANSVPATFSNVAPHHVRREGARREPAPARCR